jgi:alkanesulfonate monooxygenase SsuD/methylene tetrahydromethanopterin reductase-like flavin-dependent oxidoreductase (luciferase family)
MGHVSCGRAMLGIRIGNYDCEYEAFDVPYPSFLERAEHLEETFQAIKVLSSLREAQEDFKQKSFFGKLVLVP